MRRQQENATHESAELRQALEKAGWRFTRQRAAVYSYLCAVATHPTAEQVYLAVLAALAQPAPIVISHGTDTMVQTGRYLEPRLPRLEVPIVLTGAMTPLGFEGTDGLQNLTESLLAARLLQPGIHVVMHGQVFPIRNVRKDRSLAQFVWSPD